MTDTPIKSISLTGNRWTEISDEIMSTRPKSWLLIRSTMRKKLGFLTRTQTVWPFETYTSSHIVHLDFYDEQKKTMFILKYGPFEKGEIK
jgi:hypothetical protein